MLAHDGEFEFCGDDDGRRSLSPGAMWLKTPSHDCCWLCDLVSVRRLLDADAP